MANFGHVIFFSLIGGLFSLVGGALLLSRKGMAEKLARYATPFAAGALLAAVFLDLLKEGIAEAEINTVLVSTLVGVLLFFFAERFLHWFHHHHSHAGEGDPSRSLIVIGDTVHNALDGIAIAAAFLVSVPTGIVTTIAVAAHEIPQEIGDFGLLLSKGMPRKKVLLVNALSALATTLAAILTFALGSEDRLPIGILLGLSAGFLLYIAMSDVIPELHEHTKNKRFFSLQPLLLVVGVLTVGLAINLSHRYVHTEHAHNNEHAAEHVHNEEEHHSHETTAINNHDQLPSFRMVLTKDTIKGFNLHLETQRFRFAPDKAGEQHVIGEGHAHVYVNDIKIGRLYGENMYLSDVKVGDKVRVVLSTNDHHDIVHDGLPVAAQLTVLDMPTQAIGDPFYAEYPDAH